MTGDDDDDGEGDDGDGDGDGRDSDGDDDDDDDVFLASVATWAEVTAPADAERPLWQLRFETTSSRSRSRLVGSLSRSTNKWHATNKQKTHQCCATAGGRSPCSRSRRLPATMPLLARFLEDQDGLAHVQLVDVVGGAQLLAAMVRLRRERDNGYSRSDPTPSGARGSHERADQQRFAAISLQRPIDVSPGQRLSRMSLPEPPSRLLFPLELGRPEGRVADVDVPRQMHACPSD